MPYIIVGLGNPGEEYEGTRHNVGRMMVEKFATKHNLTEFKLDKKINALVAKGKVAKSAMIAVLPETFMNNSGQSLKSLITSAKKAEQLVVVYDDLDLPLGSIKLSWNRGDGGHRGLASIIKSLKTKKFIRVRVGVAPVTPTGKIKKPTTEKAVIDFILGKFKPAEMVELKKINKLVLEAIAAIVTDGRERAMNIYNQY